MQRAFRWVGLTLGLAVTGPATLPAADTMLIATNAVWRYLDDGSNQGTAWRAPGFSDATWSNGAGQLGYGDGDETTVVGYGPNANNKYLTTYFRRTFSVPDPALFRMLKLRLLRDDGAVVYLNGTQVRVDNMPSNTVTYTTRARADLASTYESTFYESGVPTNALVSGDNVLAVEIHQIQTNSTDISFAAELVGSTDTLFVQRGAVWRYKDDGSDQGAAWRGTNFNDATWASGPAELGYGDGDEVTVVNGGPVGNRYITTYFRRTFTATNVAALTSLKMRMLLDDGAVVYLNEIAVLTNNLSGTINYLTQAGTAVGSADEVTWNEFAIPPGVLLDGTNTIAVEVHQDAPTSSDVSFDLELVGSEEVIPQSLIRGPYLQAATSTGICVLTECATANAIMVAYGLTASHGSTSQTAVAEATSAGTYVHVVRVTGLTANTLYHYRAIVGTNQSADATFRTLVPVGTDFRFAWMADCRTVTAPHDAIAARISSAQPLFSLYGGDLCEFSTYTSFTNEFLRPNQLALAATVPFFNTPGNHETWGQNTKAFTESPASASGTQDYYSFDVGNLHVLVLNYMVSYAPGSAQFTFATNDLARASNTWKIVTCHEPAYAFGGHTPSAGVVNLATNYFAAHGVDVMLAGHNHYYEHIFTNNLHCLIVGSAGAPLATVGGPHPSLLVATSSYCYAVADVTYTNLHLVVYNSLGQVLDTLDLTKPPLPASLAFVIPPTTVHAGAAFNPAVQVAVLDLKGNTNVSATVTVALGANPVGGALTGATGVPAVTGLATFSDLAVNKMGAGYTLVASAGGHSVTSGVFNVLFADLNANGIADQWETDYFSGAISAAADPDGDGVANLGEFSAGTNPTNALNRLTVNIAAAAGQVSVTFTALQAQASYYIGYNRRYTLESRTNLVTGSWSSVPGYDAILGADQNVIHTAPLTGTSLFFRVRAWLETQ